MIKERRKYDQEDTRDIAIETRALLQEHTETDENHFIELKESVVNIESKLDKIDDTIRFATGAIAALVFLMNFPQFLNLLRPEPAHAEIVRQEMP